MKTVLYLHGFVSSPQSRKARVLGDFLRNYAPHVAYVVPELHHRPARAVEQIHAACAGVPPEDLTLVGSSLGGFYATVVAEETGCKAALLNPAVHPHARFGAFIGSHKNLYTGEAFELTREHVEELRVLDPGDITRPSRYWLIVETADEVLDYREATAYYRDAFQTVVQGGDHSLSSFPEHLPDLADWMAS